jgi:hypothetical protein
MRQFFMWYLLGLLVFMPKDVLSSPLHAEDVHTLSFKVQFMNDCYEAKAKGENLEKCEEFFLFVHNLNEILEESPFSVEQKQHIGEMLFDVSSFEAFQKLRGCSHCKEHLLALQEERQMSFFSPEEIESICHKKQEPNVQTWGQWLYHYWYLGGGIGGVSLFTPIKALAPVSKHCLCAVSLEVLNKPLLGFL